MALIDKDKTARAVTYWSRHGDPLSTRFDKRNIEDVINDLPTVEAIPIEWIERRIKDIMHEPIATDEPCFPITHAEVVILEDLIEDWRKENEKSGASD